MPNPSFIEIILSAFTIANILTVIGLFMTRKEIRRSKRLDEEILTDNIYEQNREEKLAMLADKDIAEFMADEQGISVMELKKATVASVRIMQTKRIFERHQKNQIRPEDWEGLKREIQELFTWPSILKRWEKFRSVMIDQDFQKFIDQEILIKPQLIKINTMKLTVIHATDNCDTAACPTIYQTPEGNYIIQGFKIKQAVKSEHGIPANEDMIELPKEFVQAFLASQK